MKSLLRAIRTPLFVPSLSITFAVLATVGIVACGERATVLNPLDALLTCNDLAIGGDALRLGTAVSYELDIIEPTYTVTGKYRATRDGSARIDVYSGTERVYSEGWDGTAGWKQPQDQTEPEPIGEQAAAPLRHGVEQPGHLWTLADMRPNGHAVELVTAEPGADADTRVVQLTLQDGFQQWFALSATSCLVTASRSFRAFHPDVDSTQRWVETRYAQYEEHDGVLRPMMSYNVDLATGDTIARTRVRAVTMQFRPDR